MARFPFCLAVVRQRRGRGAIGLPINCFSHIRCSGHSGPFTQSSQSCNGLFGRPKAHVGDAQFQEGFGDRQNAFAAKFLAGAELEFLDFFLERPFGHGLLRYPGPPLGKETYLYALAAAGQHEREGLLS